MREPRTQKQYKFKPKKDTERKMSLNAAILLALETFTPEIVKQAFKEIPAHSKERRVQQKKRQQELRKDKRLQMGRRETRRLAHDRKKPVEFPNGIIVQRIVFTGKYPTIKKGV